MLNMDLYNWTVVGSFMCKWFHSISFLQIEKNIPQTVL